MSEYNPKPYLGTSEKDKKNDLSVIKDEVNVSGFDKDVNDALVNVNGDVTLVDYQL